MSAPTDFVRLQRGLENEPIARLVLICISFYTNFKTGQCWPSVATLSEETGLHPTTVRRHLHDLEKRGFIKLQPRERSSSIITLVGYKPPLRDGDNRTFSETGDTSTGLGGTSAALVDTYSHSASGVLAQNSQGTSAALGEIYNINIPMNSFKKSSLDSDTTSEGLDERVFFVDGNLKLCDSLNQFWLPQFGNIQGDLDLALIQIASFVNPQNKLHSLERQVSSQLAKIVRDRKDRDRRYQSAKTISTTTKSNNSSPSKGTSYDPNALEFWAKVDRGEIKL